MSAGHVILALAFVAASLAGCTSEPAVSAPPTIRETISVSQTFDLTVFEANAATSRSGNGQSCVAIQSEDGTPTIVEGQAILEWSVKPPNPSALRLGWYDDDHLSRIQSVSGLSPLSLAFDGTAREVGHEFTLFVGTTNDSVLVVNQPAILKLNVTAAGEVRLYLKSCAVAG